jgi:hypothetical protein
VWGGISGEAEREGETMKATTPGKLTAELWDGKTPENTRYVEVVWRDIVCESDWQEGEIVRLGPKRAIVCKGYLLFHGADPDEEGATLTVIAGTWDTEAGRWSDYTFFPHEVIRSITDWPKKSRKRTR